MDRQFVERRDVSPSWGVVCPLTASFGSSGTVKHRKRFGRTLRRWAWSRSTGRSPSTWAHKDEVDDDMAARERVEDEGHPAPAHLKEKWSARGVNRRRRPFARNKILS